MYFEIYAQHGTHVNFSQNGEETKEKESRTLATDMMLVRALNPDAALSDFQGINRYTRGVSSRRDDARLRLRSRPEWSRM